MGQNTNEPVETATEQSPNSKIENGKLGMSPVIKWIIGLVVLAGIGYGTYIVGKSEILNSRSETNSNVINSNIETPVTVTPSTPTTEEPTATTTPDPTADWKTYENKEYGFSFKYPKDYVVVSYPGTFSENELQLVWDPQCSGTKFYGLAINMNHFIPGTMNEPLPLSGTKSGPTYTFYNDDHLIYITESTSCRKNQVVSDNIQTKNQTSSIDTEELDQIVSTFKFTN